MSKSQFPCCLKFQIANRLRLLAYSGSKKKEPKQVCLSVAKASHSHQTWAEVSFSAPPLPHKALLSAPLCGDVFQGVVSSKEAGNNTGLYPGNGQ
jgi:hypothetical protein